MRTSMSTWITENLAAARENARRLRHERALLAFVALVIVWRQLMPRFRWDTRLQDLMAPPVGLAATALLAALTLTCLALWNRGPDRRPLLWSVLVTAVFNCVLIALADRRGWIAGIAFRAPLPLELLVYGSGLVCLAALPLAVYRWLYRRRSPRAALLSYGVWVLLFSLGSIPLVNGMLEHGVYVFGGGYNLGWDVAWGVAQYALALAALHAFERRRRRSPDVETRPGRPPLSSIHQLEKRPV
jgi:hypothetical protein